MTSDLLPTSATTPKSDRNVRSLPEVRWALISLILFTLGGIGQLGGPPTWMWWALYLACYCAGGWEPGLAGLKALRHKALDVDLLMFFAAIGAAAIGQVFDGALLIVIFATSGALEAVATKRTADSVRGLLALAPDTAVRLGEGGVEEVIDTVRLDIGDVLVIRPGECIGGDGVVLDGASAVDQASITGEPLPVDKTTGDEVFAGTVNGTGTLRVRVRSRPTETVIARIVAMVEQASASKAGAQLLIEKIEQRYSVIVVAATIALFVIPLQFGTDLRTALLRAMTFMIVASPCALVLSTMPAMLAAIANAGRHGVLIKSAVALEKLATVTHIAFDKTGTLTRGAPRLTEVRSLVPERWDIPALLTLAAAAEDRSEHPLGRAIVATVRSAGLTPPPARDFSYVPGHGIRAVVGGAVIDIGGPTRDDIGAETRSAIEELESTGHTAIVLRVDGTPAAVFGLIDAPRREAATAVSDLSALTGTPPILLTGDNARAARLLGRQLGITDIRAPLLPAEKVDAVTRLQNAGARLMFVGDGVNDAPAMAAAHVAIALGHSGSDLALHTSDAIITRDDLASLPVIIDLARRARRIVLTNLAVAATFITGLVAWDIVGHLPLPLGVAGHEGSTILVALNGLRLLPDRAWRHR